MIVYWTLLMMNWFRWWFDAIKQQAITWASVDSFHDAIWCHKATMSWAEGRFAFNIIFQRWYNAVYSQHSHSYILGQTLTNLPWELQKKFYNCIFQPILWIVILMIPVKLVSGEYRNWPRYGLRWSDWYCNPAQHELCRPLRGRLRPRRSTQRLLCRIALPTTTAQTV